jgi:8-oxo-dGTP diphosphatase
MTEEHFIGKVGQKAVIEKGGRVLITRNPLVDGEYWELPGGRMNVGELPSEGLVRELKEELGVIVQVCEVISIAQYFHQRDEAYALMIGYRVVLEDERAQFVADPKEVAEWRWVTKAEVAEVNLYPDCADILVAYFKNR